MSISRFLGMHLLVLLVFSCTSPEAIDPNAISPPHSPEDEQKTFQLDPNFEIQLVAAEPMVQEPVAIQFDSEGRLWVVEMRGYMMDIEGSGEDQPIGRISILEDKNGDGEMDQSTVYLDSLVMPRSIGLFEGGALVAENNALWVTKDLDGDLKADSKVLLDSTYSRSGVVEHTDNGFVRNVDNWYYSAKSRLRYKMAGKEWIRDSTEFRGQWGISQDDKGRLIYNYNWSQLHGDLVPANYLFRNPNHTPSTGIDHGLTIDRRIYPIRSNLAINRGYVPGTLDENGRLLEFTSACSPIVYRSSLFPQEYAGNIFVMENAGNLIKRNVITEDGTYISGEDPNPGKEFLASTDERFRPVHGTVGPDGAFYVVDMYHGIVQHIDYMTEYLKEQTLERKLDGPVHMGRIWRIVPKDSSPKTPVKLGSKSSEELLPFLSDTDGWYRDNTQRILVERGDVSIVPKLKEIVINSSSELGAFHAIWTLEGLNQADDDFLFKVLENPSDLIKSAALRILDNKASENSNLQVRLAEAMLGLTDNGGENLNLQLALSSYSVSESGAMEILTSVLKKHGEDALMRDAVMSSLRDREFDFLQAIWQQDGWGGSQSDQEIVLEMLTAAIVKKADSKEIKAVLALADNQEFGWKEQAVLSSLAIQSGNLPEKGMIKFASEPAIFRRSDIPLESSRIEMLKSIFSWPGFDPKITEASSNSLDADAMKQFAEGRQKFLTSCASCHGANGKGANRMGPPLVNSDWVLGNEKRLTLILLHGLEGPIEVDGKKYDAPEILPVMPAHSTMDDGSIAAILTYIRNEWGNQATPVSRRTVGGMRVLTQGRVYPWSAEELNKHIENLENSQPE
ncbi:c-type cytochrome [Algoriphagus aestuarii]|nr:c-type cytochrome [Algoriphagus aestuarii]